MSALGNRSDRERIAELLRTGGIDWHRTHNPNWRDKPWTDGVPIDLDEDDQCEFLAGYLLAGLPVIVAPEPTP